MNNLNAQIRSCSPIMSTALKRISLDRRGGERTNQYCWKSSSPETSDSYVCCRLMPNLGRLTERGLVVEDITGSSDLSGGRTSTSFP